MNNILWTQRCRQCTEHEFLTVKAALFVGLRKNWEHRNDREDVSVTFLAAITLCLRKVTQEGRAHFGSECEARCSGEDVQRWVSLAVAIGGCGSWAHCTHSQEALSNACWCTPLACSFLISLRLQACTAWKTTVRVGSSLSQTLWKRPHRATHLLFLLWC